MKIKEKGITLIALAITVVVSLIIAGISITLITDKKGTINEAKDTMSDAQRESFLQKIESDLYVEQTKTGETPTQYDLINIINNKEYGTVTIAETASQNILKTKDGVEFLFLEIKGWKEKP